MTEKEAIEFCESRCKRIEELREQRDNGPKFDNSPEYWEYYGKISAEIRSIIVAACKFEIENNFFVGLGQAAMEARVKLDHLIYEEEKNSMYTY